MFELRAACQLESIAFVRALPPDLQRRLRFDYFGNLAKIFECAVGPRNSRAAERADDNYGRAGLKLYRSGARWAGCLENAQTSPPAVFALGSRISDAETECARPLSIRVICTDSAPSTRFRFASQSHSGRVRQQYRLKVAVRCSG